MVGKVSPYVLLVKVEQVWGRDYEVAVYANDNLVIRSGPMGEAKAIAEAHKIRGLLGLNNKYLIHYTRADGMPSQESVEFPCLKEASRYANENCPEGTVKIQVEEV